VAAHARQAEERAQHELDLHPGIKGFITKFLRDNVGMLAGYVSWNILTSLVPIVVGLVAISSVVLRSPSAQASVVDHLHSALQGAFSTSEIRSIVKSSTQHSGLLGIVGIIGVLWGGSNIGGAFSTAFQAIFEVNGRNFIKEKFIDIVMIFVFTALMLVVLFATVAGAFLDRLFSGLPLPTIIQFVIGTGISLFASFLLFASIYLAFPNIKPRLRLNNVWRGAVIAAILFEILTYIWPIYSHFTNFNKYGAILVPILILTAWIYFFSMIALIGAEVVAISALSQAKQNGESIGPPAGDYVPQHRVLRGKSETS
jgi:YihY family inner membrane protein